MWFAKTKFKGTGITQSEFLTKSGHGVFIAARQHFGVNKCWTRDGVIYVVAPDGSRRKVERMLDLDNIRQFSLHRAQIRQFKMSQPPVRRTVHVNRTSYARYRQLPIACILRRNNQICVHGAATSRPPFVLRSSCGARGSMSLLDRLVRRKHLLFCFVVLQNGGLSSEFRSYY